MVWVLPNIARPDYLNNILEERKFKRFATVITSVLIQFYLVIVRYFWQTQKSTDKKILKIK
jgi:hypothetical protein